MDVLRDTGAPVEVLGWDEAFVGLETDEADEATDPESFARDLAASVKAATSLDCSVGIGENKLQAKIATGFGKPAGVFRLTSRHLVRAAGRPPARRDLGDRQEDARQARQASASTPSASSPTPTRTGWGRSSAR